MVLRGKDAAQLFDLRDKAQKEGLACTQICDAGLTEVG